MTTPTLRTIRLHFAAICAALLLPALYFAYGQYLSSYSQTQPEKWAADAATFLEWVAPCVYGVGWGVRLTLGRLAKLTRTNTLLLAVAMGAVAALVLLANVHLVQGMAIGWSDVGLPVACLAAFTLPAVLFVTMAGRQQGGDGSTSSAAP